MADDPEEGTGDSQPDKSLDDRVGKLEAGQDTLAGKLDQVLGMLGKAKGEDGGGHPAEGTGGNVAAEIRQQLEERDRAARADADGKATRDRLAAAEVKLAELAEKPPQPMPRRVEKIMGWS